jgi:hypothetical protein
MCNPAIVDFNAAVETAAAERVWLGARLRCVRALAKMML